MRHRKRGRVLGRAPSHRKALMRNMASALFLTERDAELDDNKPKVKGRIVTTMAKAKEMRPYVERCITLARKALVHAEKAAELGTSADRNTDAWRQWRKSPQWREWAAARAPYVAARREAIRMLGDKSAVRVLFEDIAPRFADRQGGYTRILRLAKPRLGDAGTRAVLELVGQNDRKVQKAQKPSFGDDAAPAGEASAATDSNN